VEQASYELDKTVVRAEIPGVIVRLSVEEGENVLAGDLYNAGSPMIVIADLSQMETQILVDETEIVKVRRDQGAEVEVDAFPDRKLAGHVIEVGSSAYNAGLLDSQEAKDFRVRILLDDPPADLRPGLSARAEIVTDTRERALAVPIAALTIRDPAEEAEKAAGKRRPSRRRGSGAEDVQEVEGVFRVDDDRAVFVECRTGIAGEKDFEVVEGLAEGDRIVAGPFEAIRSLASGEKVKAKEERSPRRAARGDGGDGESDGGDASGDDGDEGNDGGAAGDEEAGPEEAGDEEGA
jgi:HlyD family secretion protein